MGARRSEHIPLGLAAAAALALTACSSDVNFNILPKASSFDSLSLKSAAPTSELRPVTPADLVDQQGRCAGAAAAQAAAVQGGIALEMTECEVISRAGAPDNVEFGTNERGERAVTLTYTGGQRPGIYRFTAGRLESIERGGEAPPAPATPKKPAPKKPKST